MDRAKRFRWIVGVSLGVLAAIGLLGVVWRHAAIHDAKPRRDGLKNQLMRRKSAAMEEILDAMVRGNLRRIEEPATAIAEYASVINYFLDTDVYREHGAEFYDSLEALKSAAREKDKEKAKEATLRLERSCIECHSLFNQAE